MLLTQDTLFFITSSCLTFFSKKINLRELLKLFKICMDSRKSFYKENPAQCIQENASKQYSAEMCSKYLPFFRLTTVYISFLCERFCSSGLQIHTQAPYKNMPGLFVFAVYTLKIEEWFYTGGGKDRTSAMLLRFLKCRWRQCTFPPPLFQNWMQTFLSFFVAR